jgi:hypothetical protein
MVEDVDMESFAVNDCQDVNFHDERFKHSDIYKIVHGDEICHVLPFMHKYEQESVNDNYVVERKNLNSLTYCHYL